MRWLEYMLKSPPRSCPGPSVSPEGHLVTRGSHLRPTCNSPPRKRLCVADGICDGKDKKLKDTCKALKTSHQMSVEKVHKGSKEVRLKIKIMGRGGNLLNKNEWKPVGKDLQKNPICNPKRTKEKSVEGCSQESDIKAWKGNETLEGEVRSWGSKVCTSKGFETVNDESHLWENFPSDQGWEVRSFSSLIREIINEEVACAKRTEVAAEKPCDENSRSKCENEFDDKQKQDTNRVVEDNADEQVRFYSIPEVVERFPVDMDVKVVSTRFTNELPQTNGLSGSYNYASTVGDKGVLTLHSTTVNAGNLSVESVKCSNNPTFAAVNPLVLGEYTEAHCYSYRLCKVLLQDIRLKGTNCYIVEREGDCDPVPVEGDSDSVPVEGDSDSVPVEGDCDPVPVEGDCDPVPVEGDCDPVPVEAPVEGEGDCPCTVEGEGDCDPVPVEGDSDSVPVEGDSDSVPVEGDCDPVPVEGDCDPVPVEGDCDPVPVEGEGDPVPIDGDCDPVPVEGDSDSVPVEGDSDSVPVEGDCDPVPVEGDSDSVPVEGDSDSVPVEGDCDPVPVEGDCDPVPVEGEGDPVPIDGDCDPVPVEGDCDPVPVEGDCVPVPVEGEGDPVPIDGDSDSVPVEGDCDPVPVEGDCDPVPVEGDCDPVPVEVTDPEPVEGDCDPVPVEGEGDCDPVPVEEGDCDPVPVEGDCDPVPVEGEGDPVPVEGDCDPVPVEGDCDPVPVEGESDPLPVEGVGDSDPVPVEGDCDPVPVEGDCDPVPVEGDCDPVPVEGESDPLPVEGVGDCDPVPVEGDCDSVPVEGDCDSVPVEGDCDSVPVEGDCDSVSVKGESDSDPVPVEGDCGSVPVEGESAHHGFTALVIADHYYASVRGNINFEAKTSRLESDHNQISVAHEGSCRQVSPTVESKAVERCVEVDEESDSIGVSKGGKVDSEKEVEPVCQPIEEKHSADDLPHTIQREPELDLTTGSITHDGITQIEGNFYVDIQPCIRDTGVAELDMMVARTKPGSNTGNATDLHNQALDALTVEKEDGAGLSIIEKLSAAADDRNIKVDDVSDSAGRCVSMCEPLSKGHTMEVLDQCYQEKNDGLERNISCVISSASKEGQPADKDAKDSYASEHLLSLLQLSGALSNNNNLLLLPRPFLTVEMVMAAINISLFSANDVFSWICKICKSKNRRYTALFERQFLQYLLLYEYITKEVHLDQKEAWKNLIQQSIYRIPRGSGISLIFGTIPALCKKEGIYHFPHSCMDKCTCGDNFFGPLGNQRKDGTQGYLKNEIARLRLELKGKEEEIRCQQENSKEEVIKLKEELCRQQDILKFDDALKAELKSAWCIIQTHRQGTDHLLNQTTEGEEIYLIKPHDVLVILQQIVFEKESNIIQIQKKLNTSEDKLKARDITISQQQESMCKSECEMAKTKAHIKQLQKEVMSTKSKLEDCKNVICNQQKQLKKWNNMSFDKPHEENLARLRLEKELWKRDQLIHQQKEEIAQLESAAKAGVSLSGQFQYLQTLHSQLEYDLQQKETLIQTLNQELNSCKNINYAKEAYIKKLHDERNTYSKTELEERLVYCNSLLVEKDNRISALQRDLTTLQEKEKEKETHVESLEKEPSYYMSASEEPEATSSNDRCSVTKDFHDLNLQKYQDQKYLQNHPMGKITGKKISKDYKYCKVCAEYVLLLKKKDEQVKLGTDSILELEKEVIYLYKQLKDSPSTDKKTILLEHRSKVSELRRCICSREQMNAQLEERLRAQEMSIKKLISHIETKDVILSYLHQQCNKSDTSPEVCQGERTFSLVTDDSKHKFLDDPEDSCGLVMQRSPKQLKMETSDKISLNPIIEDLHSSTTRWVSLVRHPETSQENTDKTVEEDCVPSTSAAKEANCNKKVVIKELQHTKITLSDYRVRNKQREHLKTIVEENPPLPCSSYSSKQGMKRKNCVTEVVKTCMDNSSSGSEWKNKHSEKKRKIISSENFHTELDIKKNPKTCSGPGKYRSAVKESYQTLPPRSTSNKPRSYKCTQQPSEGCGEEKNQKNYREELVRLKKVLELFKVKNEKVYEEKKKLEKRLCEREITMAQLVKDKSNVEMQLRQSDTALAIIENDRGRIYALHQILEHNHQNAINTKNELVDLIFLKEEALKLSQEEVTTLKLIIEQSHKSHRDDVEELKRCIIVKGADIDRLMVENKMLKEVCKENENLLKITEQLKKDLYEKNNMVDAQRIEKDLLMKELKEKDMNLKIKLEEKVQLETILQEQLTNVITIEEEKNCLERKLLEIETKIKSITEENLDKEKTVRESEQEAALLRQKVEALEATLVEKTRDLSLMQKELRNIQISRKKDLVLAEKQKQELAKLQLQVSSEHIFEKERMEALVHSLKNTIISEREKSRIIKKEADDKLALGEQEMLTLKRYKEHVDIEIRENTQKYLASQKELEEAHKANTILSDQFKDIQANRCLIRKELKLESPATKTVNLREELDSVCRLNHLLKEQKRRITMLKHELLGEDSRNKKLLKRLQIIRGEKANEKRKAKKDNKVHVNTECQTTLSLGNDLDINIESMKNLQTALEIEKRVSESFSEKLLLEQKKSLILATGLKREYEECSKDLEYQLSLFAWVAEKYRAKMHRVEELTALSVSSDTAEEDMFADGQGQEAQE
ncbi:Bile salt-activated lipase-like 5 [Homarus americanus]|uniref:Bile salt-activated lipase-like 5 n=1 Tax=Homarus americanus TaxID=6706 RepID=A0A8J5MRZ7_HOMAM|nr:Bile salt-activated lipase-like 5 [Homarus americanus]